MPFMLLANGLHMCTKRFFATAFLSLTFAFTAINTAASATPEISIQHWTSKNGVPVYFVAKTQAPFVYIVMLFHAGSAYDAGSAGIAQLTANMLDQGTRTLDAKQIAYRFKLVGAQYSARIDRDMAIVKLYSWTYPTFLNPAVSNYAELLSHANFPENELKLAKKQRQIFLLHEQQIPEAIATNTFYKSLYGKQPYASPPRGTLQSIPLITRTQLMNFYQRYYVAKNAILIMVGNITKDKATSLAEQLSSALPPGKKAKPVPTTTTSLSHYQNKIDYPTQHSAVLLGQQIGITLNDPDYFPFLIGNQILGNRLTARLASGVRDKRGLSVNSWFSPLEAGGPFCIGFQTQNDQAATALAITQTTLKNFIAQGPSEQELIASKQMFMNCPPLGIDNNNWFIYSPIIIWALEKIAFYELPLNYVDDYRKKINAVNVTQVRETFRKHIKPGKLLVVIVGKN